MQNTLSIIKFIQIIYMALVLHCCKAHEQINSKIDLMMTMMKLPILPCTEKLELVLSTEPKT